MVPRPPRPPRRHPPLAAVLLALLPLAGGACAAARPTVSPPVGTTADLSVDAAVAAATFDSAWTIVGRTYYDSAMRGVDWAAARAELRPAAERARTLVELRAVVQTLLARLGESHLAIVPGEALERDATAADTRDVEAEPGDAGLSLRVVEGEIAVARVEPRGPAARAGVRPGWTLVAVDGWTRGTPRGAPHDTTGGAVRRREHAMRAARGAELHFDGTAGDTVRATFADARGDTVRVHIARRATPGTVVRFGALPPQLAHLAHERRATPDGCVGVVRFNVWMTPVLPPLGRAMAELGDCAGIVVDLRGNPGGVAGMIAAASGWFLDSAATLGTMRTRGTALRFVAVPRRVTDAGRPTRPYAGRVAIVVDGHTASTSEFFAGGLQALGRARVFGDTTSGMALPAGMALLPSGDALLHVLADYVDAAGRRLESRGVAPDVYVPLTLGALRTGRDVQLGAAVRWAVGRGSTGGCVSCR